MGAEARKVGTGIPGLDDILSGGFAADRLHLVSGQPGSGKTTLALHFLMEGSRQGEPVLCVTLSETAEELNAVAASHGWDIGGIALHELAPDEETLRPNEQYTILHPSEVELAETTWAVLEEVERSKPARVVVDSLAELRLMARDQLRYRRQILGLKRFLAGRHCTVLLLDSDDRAPDVQSIAHSILHLEQVVPEYGRERWRLCVLKSRAQRYRGGLHDFVIRPGGITVFPRLIAAEHDHSHPVEAVSTGVPELDRLLGNGLDRGTSTLFIGPAGAGKSLLCTQQAAAMAQRGERGTIYILDESLEVFRRRAENVGIPVGPLLADERIRLRRLDPAQLAPGEFEHEVRFAVESQGAGFVVIDSLNGYMNAMAEERAVLIQLHELLTYLGQRGVLTMMTVAQHGLVGEQPVSPLDISYLADTVILLRYFEAAGRVRQAISVVKRRGGAHERTIRELQIGPGIRLSEPLVEFQGVLSGTPVYLGSDRALFVDGDS